MRSHRPGHRPGRRRTLIATIEEADWPNLAAAQAELSETLLAAVAERNKTIGVDEVRADVFALIVLRSELRAIAGDRVN